MSQSLSPDYTERAAPSPRLVSQWRFHCREGGGAHYFQGKRFAFCLPFWRLSAPHPPYRAGGRPADGLGMGRGNKLRVPSESGYLLVGTLCIAPSR